MANHLTMTGRSKDRIWCYKNIERDEFLRAARKHIRWCHLSKELNMSLAGLRYKAKSLGILSEVINIMRENLLNRQVVDNKKSQDN